VYRSDYSFSPNKFKGYEQIVKRAKKFDKNPQLVNEVDERSPQDVAKAGRGFMTDTSKKWKYSMTVVIDKDFGNYLKLHKSLLC